MRALMAADIVVIQLNALHQLNFKITFIKPLVLNNRTLESRRRVITQGEILSKQVLVFSK